MFLLSVSLNKVWMVPNLVKYTFQIPKKYIYDQKNATIEFCQVRHVVHKHELPKLTITRALSKESGLFEFIDFHLSSMLANIHEYFNYCH